MIDIIHFDLDHWHRARTEWRRAWLEENPPPAQDVTAWLDKFTADEKVWIIANPAPVWKGFRADPGEKKQEHDFEPMVGLTTCRNPGCEMVNMKASSSRPCPSQYPAGTREKADAAMAAALAAGMAAATDALKDAHEKGKK